MPWLYGLSVGDRIEFEYIDLPDNETNLRPGDKGIVDKIKEIRNNYEIYVI